MGRAFHLLILWFYVVSLPAEVWQWQIPLTIRSGAWGIAKRPRMVTSDGWQTFCSTLVGCRASVASCPQHRGAAFCPTTSFMMFHDVSSCFINSSASMILTRLTRHFHPFSSTNASIAFDCRLFNPWNCLEPEVWPLWIYGRTTSCPKLLLLHWHWRSRRT